MTLFVLVFVETDDRRDAGHLGAASQPGTSSARYPFRYEGVDSSEGGTRRIDACEHGCRANDLSAVRTPIATGGSQQCHRRVNVTVRLRTSSRRLLLQHDGAVQHVHPAGKRDVSRLGGRKVNHDGSFSGSARLMFNDGNTTPVPQVLSVVRTNVMSAGLPARSVACRLIALFEPPSQFGWCRCRDRGFAV